MPKPITRPLPGSTLVRILARVVTVRKTGGSIVVVIPAYLARTAGIEAGDKAEMKPIVDEDKGIVTGFSIEMRD